jgi:hypothetical protein
MMRPETGVQGPSSRASGLSEPNKEAVRERILGEKKASAWDSEAGGRWDGMM